MNKEIEKAAAQALAEDINAKHQTIMVLLDGVKDVAKEIGGLANEVGMALTSARDTIGPAFHHWIREHITFTTAVAERYIRHHVHYHPDQLLLPGFKLIEDRASVVAQAEANAEVAEGDQPRQDEVPELTVKDIAWSWVHDANRCFKQHREKIPPETMNAQQIEDTLRVVKPVRDAIWAYEKRLVALTGGQQ